LNLIELSGKDIQLTEYFGIKSPQQQFFRVIATPAIHLVFIISALLLVWNRHDTGSREIKMKHLNFLSVIALLMSSTVFCQVKMAGARANAGASNILIVEWNAFDSTSVTIHPSLL
jgi:hypothetical protein